MRRVLTRLLEVPSRPGQWGETLSSMLAAWLALCVASSNPAWRLVPPLHDMAHTFGRWWLAAWLAWSALCPIAASMAGCPLARVLASTQSMATWLALAVVTAADADIISPHVGIYAVGFLASIVSEYRLTRNVRVNIRWSHRSRSGL